ncbi:hypothetical protein BDY19DRAFT_911741 [Irpex rosettiformis]|uniref:Uncharacterized protein n=1 Tax=Irpex rosettiformis TaxID=378272 RepID=A0ACB8UIS3_9APHY|nr:hypothetical protein BDY19DRAFT_911741 [Irpex rosettiformis]
MTIRLLDHPQRAVCRARRQSTQFLLLAVPFQLFATTRLFSHLPRAPTCIARRLETPFLLLSTPYLLSSRLRTSVYHARRRGHSLVLLATLLILLMMTRLLDHQQTPVWRARRQRPLLLLRAMPFKLQFLTTTRSLDRPQAKICRVRRPNTPLLLLPTPHLLPSRLRSPVYHARRRGHSLVLQAIPFEI